jgi:hypothetical protein
MYYTSRKLQPEAVKELAAASISATYANVGSATSFPWNIATIRNGTDAEVYISWNNGINHMRLASLQVEQIQAYTNGSYIPKGTQFQAKLVGAAPTTGSVVIEGYHT